MTMPDTGRRTDANMSVTEMVNTTGMGTVSSGIRGSRAVQLLMNDAPVWEKALRLYGAERSVESDPP